MSSSDLVHAVEYRLSLGESRETIKAFLLSEGWQSDVIDEVFTTLPTPASFWQKLPFYSYFSQLDAKSAGLPGHVIVVISFLLVVFVIGIIYLTYLFMGPTNSGSLQRDTLRESAYTQLQTALRRFHDQTNRYPSSISDLIPAFLTSVPSDPLSNKPYDYMPLANGVNYKLCVYFETRSASSECSNSGFDSVAQPTITPSILFVSPGISYSLTGTVFLDYNTDGKREKNEPAFGAVTIVVLDGAGNTQCTSQSDAMGSFLCPIMKQGTYQTILSVPHMYKSTFPNPQTITLSVSHPTVSLFFGLAPLSLPTGGQN